MNHEPECPAKEFPYFCACVEIQDAYRRGREDERAAKPPVVLSFRRPITNKQYRRIAAYIAAARGDGEQA